MHLDFSLGSTMQLLTYFVFASFCFCCLHATFRNRQQSFNPNSATMRQLYPSPFPFGGGCNCPPGPPGAPGPNGLPGADGDPGEKGPIGDQGDMGLMGPAGRRGRDARNGERGATGERGRRGPQGFTGPLGEMGPMGVQGAPGPRGLPGVDAVAAGRTAFYNLEDFEYPDEYEDEHQFEN